MRSARVTVYLPWSKTVSVDPVTSSCVMQPTGRPRGNGPGRPASRSRRLSAARRKLLARPTVPVRVREEDERAPGEVLHLADVEAARRELGPRLVHVGDHELETAYRARLGVGDPRSDRDRARRSGRRQLHEADPAVDAVV